MVFSEHNTALLTLLAMPSHLSSGKLLSKD